MFLSVFWTVNIPVVTIILSIVGEWLIRSLRQLHAYAQITCSKRQRIRERDELGSVRSGGTADASSRSAKPLLTASTM
jgi:hypothetical protein